MKECDVCAERDRKIREYGEKIEREKVEACLKALEREKIAKGMQCSRQDEILLKEQQKQQMEERRMIDIEQREIENMWHEVLIQDVRQKELRERQAFEKKRQEALERRLAYDEQIQSANRARREMIRAQREEENRILEKMKIKMAKDHYDEIKHKEEQQIRNRNNFIEGHQMKISKIRNDKERERRLDNKMIEIALEELRAERERKYMEMASFKTQQELLIKSRYNERSGLHKLEEHEDLSIAEFRNNYQRISDDNAARERKRQVINKQKAAQEYTAFLSEQEKKIATQREKHASKMDDVKRMAFKELQNKLDDAKEEIRRQTDYRNVLQAQIRNNQRQMEFEQNEIERKQAPFVKKVQMFRDVTQSRIPESIARTSTNPVHPFKKAMDAHKDVPVHLPLIPQSCFRT